MQKLHSVLGPLQTSLNSLELKHSVKHDLGMGVELKLIILICVCLEETGQVKNSMDECSLKVTHPDVECSKILVSNPASVA